VDDGPREAMRAARSLGEAINRHDVYPWVAGERRPDIAVVA
jgi:hypothetical protein